MAYTTIDTPTDYFNTKLYVGNASTQSITGVGFQPDWVWLKDRTNANSGRINDSVRGATKYLIPSTNGAEATESAGLTSFDSDGFSLGSNSDFNGSSANFVSWNWLAGGSASSNSDGSITSNVSANTTSGFSIISYTGTGSNATVGHGLSSAPKVLIVKRRDDAVDWSVFHTNLGSNNYRIRLNSTDTHNDDTAYWNGTAPTSSVFSVGTDSSTNASSGTYVCYAFAEKQGFSKFGKYTGNGNADGTFVYTGFRPAFVIHKRIDSSNNWNAHDSKRSPFNTADERLYLNLNNGENSGGDYGDDFLSNGFKIKTTEAGWNASGGTYIYFAFAEAPFVNSKGVPCNAR